MKDNNFKNKYNFDIFTIEDKKPEYVKTIFSYKKFQFIGMDNILINEQALPIKRGLNDQNDEYEAIKVIEYLDEIKIKKIKEESKSYYTNLERKVKLNSEIIKILYTNFYNDEFNHTRNSVYLLFGIPTSIMLAFSFISPSHPTRNMVINMGLISTFVFFIFNFNKEIDQLTMDKKSKTGIKLRKLRNELGLYNPLAKTFTD